MILDIWSNLSLNLNQDPSRYCVIISNDMYSFVLTISNSYTTWIELKSNQNTIIACDVVRILNYLRTTCNEPYGLSLRILEAYICEEGVQNRSEVQESLSFKIVIRSIVEMRRNWTGLGGDRRRLWREPTRMTRSPAPRAVSVESCKQY